MKARPIIHKNVTEILPSDINLRDYAVSEKYDGIQVEWTGKRMFTRGGKRLYLHPSFESSLPKWWFTGELWAGRGNLSQVLSLAAVSMNRTPSLKEQMTCRVAIFNSEHMNENSVDKRSAFIVKEMRVSGIKGLQVLFDSIIRNGGEGLILRDLSYRSEILKVKPYYTIDCRMVGFTQGKVNHIGMFEYNGQLFNCTLPRGCSYVALQKAAQGKAKAVVACKEITQAGFPREPRIENFIGRGIK